MRNLYLLLFPPFLASCGTIVDYVGNSYPPSNKVDVFVTLPSVKREYQVIGKGYANSALMVRRVGERVQKKAVQKARSKGADAVVIQDYLLMQPLLSSDSSKGGVALSNIAVNQGQQGFVVLFLKYTQ
jgi:hypothetical protein